MKYKHMKMLFISLGIIFAVGLFFQEKFLRERKEACHKKGGIIYNTGYEAVCLILPKGILDFDSSHQ